MDNKDQRNGTVPLGTFNQEATAEHGDHGDGAGTADITGAYVRADDIQLEAVDDTPIDFGTTRPGRKRVRTLLGVPLVNAQAPASASTVQRSDHISEAIRNMLDGQASQGERADPTESLASTIDIEIDEVEFDSETESEVLLPDSDVVTWVESSSHAVIVTPVEEFENQPTSSGTTSSSTLPLLIPAQYADAQARDRAEPEAEPAFAAETPVAASVFPAAVSSRPSRRSQGRVSSLAPRETTRRSVERDAAPGIGFLWVAAMALIASTGWYFTAGTFSRAAQPQAAVTQPPAPPVNEAPMAAPTPPVVVQAPTAPATPEPQPTAAKPVPTTKRALTATSRSPRTKMPPAPKLVPDNLAETPSRSDVVQRLEAVRPSVRACAAGLSGVADLDITIAHSGVVTHVLVGGDFAGTTQGSCIARAVREARFPSFKQERFRLLYPYAI
jgi:hypothetical protein